MNDERRLVIIATGRMSDVGSSLNRRRGPARSRHRRRCRWRLYVLLSTVLLPEAKKDVRKESTEDIHETYLTRFGL